MATATASLFRDNSTVANFKAWAKQIDDWLRAAGWTYTAQTGDLGGNANWGAVAAVPGSNVTWFLCYVYNSDFAGSPIYMKYIFGNKGSTNNPVYQIQFGSALNGSGTLTNPTDLIIGASVQAGDTTALHECRFWWDGPDFWIAMWWDFNTVDAQCFYAGFRSIDGSGARTGDHYTAIASCYTGTGGQQTRQRTIAFSSPPTLGYNKQGVNCLQNLGTTLTANSKTPVSPIWPNAGVFDYPSKMFMIGRSGDFADSQQVAISIYGTSHNYFFAVPNGTIRTAVTPMDGVERTGVGVPGAGVAVGLIWE